MNAILRRQFTERERLTYPITWLPLEMGRDPAAFLRGRIMWIGFGIAAGIGILNGMSVFYPSLPALRVGWQVIPFETKPWSYIDPTRVSFQPFVIGLAYFMPLDLAFSAWFFYFVKMATQLIVRSTTGTRELYLDEQVQGVWIALGLLTLWVGRRHVTDAMRLAFRGGDA